jgi:hypothetical protein
LIIFFEKEEEEGKGLMKRVSSFVEEDSSFVELDEAFSSLFLFFLLELENLESLRREARSLQKLGKRVEKS